MSAPKLPHRADPPTVDRLRSDIDEGRSGDKVRFPDPAAAPLGSDDEAAGTPVSEDQRRLEADARLHAEAPRREAPEALWLYALLIVGAAFFIAGVLTLLRLGE